MSMPEAPGPDVLTVVQITDTHLFESVTGTLMGVPTQESCAEVLALVQAQHPEIDALVCTGDIVQDHSTAPYVRLAGMLDTLCPRQLWVAGNHDDPALMRHALGPQAACLAPVLTLPGWALIRVDSRQAGAVAGYIAEDTLNSVESHIRQAEAEGRHVLLCTHHNPVPVAAAWLQRHALQNPEPLLSLMAAHDVIKGLLFGHVHQSMAVQKQGQWLLACPATSVQFHPSKNDFALDTCGPGFRWLRLYPSGDFETGISRLPAERFRVDFSGAGY